jgi:hypothetical protein
MLGIGPIMEGYSIIATKEHVPSMFDLKPSQLQDFVEYRKTVSGILSNIYGPLVITEHGRVTASDFYNPDRDAHCYHAHQLVFPVAVDLAPDLKALYGGNLFQYEEFSEAYDAHRKAGEYLYYEFGDGCCVVENIEYPRQFFRKLIAEKIGVPHRADWSRWKGWKMINQAKERLKEKGYKVGSG